MGEAELLINFIEEINAHKFENFSNNPTKNHKQSAVAIIIRCAPEEEKNLNLNFFQGEKNKENLFLPKREKLESLFSSFLAKNFSNQIFQILFLQRAISEKDLHSGEICFPGGKCDNNETDYEAVIREVKEEVDYDLMKNEFSIYLGKLPKNFYVYFTRNGVLHVSIHLFFLINYEKISKYSKFNDKEVFELKWFPLKKLLYPPKEIFVIKKVQAKRTWVQNYPKIVQKVFSSMIKNYDHSEYSGLDIGLNDTLYGLTFFMVVYMLSIVDFIWITDTDEKKKLKDLLEFANYNKMFYRKSSIIEKIGSWFGSQWYKKHRIDQFKYKGSNKKKDFNWALFIVIFAAFILFCFFKF